MSKRIKITEAEHVRLIDESDGRTITTQFGPGGVYVTGNTEEWVLQLLLEWRMETADAIAQAIRDRP